MIFFIDVFYIGNLRSQNRRLSELKPATPAVAPFLNVPQSSTSLVEIEWGPSSVRGITDAVIFYNISYTLNAGSSVMVTVNEQM